MRNLHENCYANWEQWTWKQWCKHPSDLSLSLSLSLWHLFWWITSSMRLQLMTWWHIKIKQFRLSLIIILLAIQIRRWFSSLSSISVFCWDLLMPFKVELLFLIQIAMIPFDLKCKTTSWLILCHIFGASGMNCRSVDDYRDIFKYELRNCRFLNCAA